MKKVLLKKAMLFVALLAVAVGSGGCALFEKEGSKTEEATHATADPAGVPAALVEKMTPGSCCATAAADGNVCAHPCCAEAIAAGKICEKCNSSP